VGKAQNLARLCRNLPRGASRRIVRVTRASPGRQVVGVIGRPARRRARRRRARALRTGQTDLARV